MKKLLKLSIFTLFIAVGAFAFTSLNPSAAIAQENEEAPAQEEQQQEQEQEAAPSSRYTYTAQPGDSYTKIARKAVQTFGYFENVNLSLAEIVAAETFLTQDAGSPLLDVGQEVSINEEALENAINRAQELDDSAELLWERYVPYVDFDTNNVGEPQS